MEELIQQINTLIDAKRLKEAHQVYKKLNALYVLLPKEEKKKYYTAIVKIIKRFKEKTASGMNLPDPISRLGLLSSRLNRELSHKINSVNATNPSTETAFARSGFPSMNLRIDWLSQ